MSASTLVTSPTPQKTYSPSVTHPTSELDTPDLPRMTTMVRNHDAVEICNVQHNQRTKTLRVVFADSREPLEFSPISKRDFCVQRDAGGLATKITVQHNGEAILFESEQEFRRRRA